MYLLYIGTIVHINSNTAGFIHFIGAPIEDEPARDYLIYIVMLVLLCVVWGHVRGYPAKPYIRPGGLHSGVKEVWKQPTCRRLFLSPETGKLREGSRFFRGIRAVQNLRRAPRRCEAAGRVCGVVSFSGLFP